MSTPCWEGEGKAWEGKVWERGLRERPIGEGEGNKKLPDAVFLLNVPCEFFPREAPSAAPSIAANATDVSGSAANATDAAVVAISLFFMLILYHPKEGFVNPQFRWGAFAPSRLIFVGEV